MKKLLTLALIAAFASPMAQAQDKKEKKDKSAKTADQSSTAKKRWNRVTIGAHFGYMMSFTDIRQYDFAVIEDERFNFGGGLRVGYQINPVFGAEGHLWLGSQAGVERGRPKHSYPYTGAQENVKFNTFFVDYSVVGTVNLVNLVMSDRTKPRKVTAYVGGGIGMVSFRTLKVRRDAAETFVGSEGYTKKGTETKEMTNEVMFPIVGGLKFRLSKRIDLGLESSLRIMNSDKLDATVVKGSARDMYGYTSIFVNVKLGKNENSMEWENPFEAMNRNMADIQANIDGLAKDADGDGVSDLFDKEEATAAGVAVDGSGRSLDSDGDGVPNHLDADPFTNKGARVDGNGKELDSDGDGVGDSQDLEPNTAAGALVNFQGKTINVKDGKDAAGSGSGSGSGSFSGSGALASIYFKVNSSRIDYWTSYDKLAEVAKVMKANSGVKMTVVGHADKTGSEDYNKSLAEKRAQSAVDHLAKVYGIDKGRFTVEAAGVSNPLAVSDDALNVNRRVDFFVK